MRSSRVFITALLATVFIGFLPAVATPATSTTASDASDFTAGRQTSPAPNSTSSSPAAAGQQSLSDFEKRLARINEQIADIKSRIESETQKESTVLSNLARLNLNKSLIQKELSADTVQLERAGADLAGIQANIRGLKASLERDNASIERTLVTLYKFGRLNFFHFLLQAKNFETYTSESKRLSLLARYEENVISGYLKSLVDLGTAQAKLESKKRDVAELVRAASLKKQELEAEERKSTSLVQDIQRNKQTYEQTLQELRESTEQLQLMMKKIISQEWALPSAFVPLYEKKGKLAWPLEGKIITAFGFQRHPQFNTIIMNNGVEIQPQKDKSLVRAIHAGKIVYADYFQGYGNLLIVDHGMTYFTLYGHCSEFLVALGDMVRPEQPIALVGDSGSLKGECLYFEIRYKTKALDPAQWLKRR